MREGQAQAREDSGLCMQDSGLGWLHTVLGFTLFMSKTLAMSGSLQHVLNLQAVDDKPTEDAVWSSVSTINTVKEPTTEAGK
ncbi:unnamed protein product [Fusarium venenatum]|uniref:Uncharacterized protein n=1 Tax=Fusarium venenatum TaxID=56646 RepID=A0A2L2SNL2_9HYPO|nr:uncharacterized protein FVRRES_11847 [Fusarium venenatum]CEI39156.1 unnamed protein product [Fusarium venenatum]